MMNLTYLLTYLLTPWCRMLFEKLIVTQLVKKSYFLMEPEGSLPCSHKPAAAVREMSLRNLQRMIAKVKR
jgi:hypothetical protein